jgi:inner membrane protein
MHTGDTSTTPARRIGNSATFKLLTISALILILMVPTEMVKSLIGEREGRKNGVIKEISAKWGREQTLTGPMISVPYLKHIKNEQGEIITMTRHLQVLPDRVDIDGRIVPEIRYRGIFQAVLYHTTLSIDGSFSRVPLETLHIAPEDMLWSDAVICLGISDTRGIQDCTMAAFNGKPLAIGPGVESTDGIAAGISAPIQLSDSGKRYPFHIELNLKGSRRLDFTPVGKVTTVTVRSNWRDPSFSGAFLPVEREVSAKGFSAKWKVLQLNHDYPQYWKSGNHDLASSVFGVSLFTPVDIYQKSMRTAKYALMFIVFTFMAFFLSEVMLRLRVHPVQYLLIGLAVIVFYALLLSISEQVHFGVAYLVSALAIIGLITSYTKAILKHTAVTLMVGGLLSLLYAYLYILLQLQDYALLMGSIGLFAVLSAVMFLTRKIDWYAIQPSFPKADPS